MNNRLNFEKFEKGQGTYTEIIETLCQDPDDYQEFLKDLEEDNEYQRRIKAEVSEIDIARAFDLSTLKGHLNQQVLQEIRRFDYEEGMINETNLRITTPVEEIQKNCSNPITKAFKEGKTAKYNDPNNDENRLNLNFKEKKYEASKIIESEPNYLQVRFPSKESFADQFRLE